MFIDGHERPDGLEYRNQFSREIEAIKPYLVEFEEDRSMKSKIYLEDRIVGGSNRQPIIFITHDESTFNANDGQRQVWQEKNHSILRPKGRGKGIMISDFLLPWSQLNLLVLSDADQNKLVSLVIPLEAVELFEYGKIMMDTGKERIC